MTAREQLPVWAKILLGIPVTDSHSQCAEPGGSSAPAPNKNPDTLQYLSRLDRVLHNEQLRRRILLQEAVQ